MITIPKTGHGMSELNSRRRYLDLNDVLSTLRDEFDLLGTILSLLTRGKREGGKGYFRLCLNANSLPLLIPPH